MMTECCCCSVCCYTAVVAAAAAVHHRVPDGNKCFWFIEADFSVFFLFIQNNVFNVPLGGTVAFTASICLYYILGNYGHARSQRGRHSATAKNPCVYYIDIGHMYPVPEVFPHSKYPPPP